MENASKAILLSGAVLIAIILISLGIYVISSQQRAIEQSERTGQVVSQSTFNSTFLKYQGIRRGSEIKQLYVDIKATNNAYQNEDYGQIDCTQIDHIKPYGQYRVTVQDLKKNDGYVDTITIEPINNE